MCYGESVETEGGRLASKGGGADTQKHLKEV